MFSVRVKCNYAYNLEAENMEEAVRKALELRYMGDYGELTWLDIDGFEVERVHVTGGTDEDS